LEEALRKAKELDLDLVEISPNTDPPVCKIINYKKFIYDQKKKQKSIKSKAQKVIIKELRFGPNTGEHDFEFKLKHARSFLEDGAKVRAFVFFRGRTIIFKAQGEILLLKPSSKKPIACFNLKLKSCSPVCGPNLNSFTTTLTVFALIAFCFVVFLFVFGSTFFFLLMSFLY
jgi:translation initiation factor IF-3